MFMQFVRTNNNVEGTHNNLKAVVGSAYTNIVKFLSLMKEVADKIALTAKLLSQKQVLKKVYKNAESMQYQLCNLWDSYQRTINPISSEKLRRIGGQLNSSGIESKKAIMSSYA
ncbi:hypothetical protein DAPPUDRAFT_320325 [Daphnia pulex]|uniref:Uncharacterized protein n=1 Tax=Daphnia pulex TaxID=6669 RepID=E9GPJ3_DAPPU|nr:hypothetical protein DAPPUDRAFT_320325 [Daphnia pulex]|eukprot:EFX78667.1 hypothetical protein DAPPUDRAFT_320325 [Daphnia pulex]